MAQRALGCRGSVCCSLGSGQGDADAGEDAQVQFPHPGRPLDPEVLRGADVSPCLELGHAGDGAEVGERLVGATGDVGIAEVRDEMAGRAQSDESAQRLDPGAVVVVSPLVRFEPPQGCSVLGGSARLAAVG
ncbi:MAG: hypothetical protein LC799_35455 [Actinobacteria bacterium]|nr:hypothetical protein [Actinomycetota bacterium]